MTRDVYALGFAEFLASLLPPTYALADKPAADPGPGRARFEVFNAVGEGFVVEIEHLGVREGAADRLAT